MKHTTIPPIERQRTKCEIYTIVMGYFRPVSHFNIGKKAEHYGRKHFSESVSINSRFIKKYSQQRKDNHLAM